MNDSAASEPVQLSRFIILRHDPGFPCEYRAFDCRSGDETCLNPLTYNLLSLLEHDAYAADELSRLLHASGSSLPCDKLRTFLGDLLHREILVPSSEVTFPRKVGRDPEILTRPARAAQSVPVAMTPVEVGLHLTNRCNLNCVHCRWNAPASDPEHTLCTAAWKDVLDELEELRVQTVSLTGGEPLLHPDFWQILDYASTKRFRVRVATNATLIDSENAGLLAKPNVVTIVSLDGMEDTHDQFRGRPGCFEQVADALRHLSEEGASFAVATVCHAKNLDELEDIVQLSTATDAEEVSLFPIQAVGRAQDAGSYLLSLPDLKKAGRIAKGLKESFADTITVDPAGFAGSSTSMFVKEGLVFCAAGTRTIAIRADGEVDGCSYGFFAPEYRIGNVKQTGLRELWQTENWAPLRGGTRIEDLPQCRACEHLSDCVRVACRLGAAYEYGDFYGVPPHCKKRLEGSEQTGGHRPPGD